MNCSVYTGHTKNGKEYTALKIVIGEYETLIFPNKIELLYIKSYLQKQAHEDFKDGLNVDEN